MPLFVDKMWLFVVCNLHDIRASFFSIKVFIWGGCHIQAAAFSTSSTDFCSCIPDCLWPVRRINAVVQLKRGLGSGIVALEPFLFFPRALTFCHWILVALNGYKNTKMSGNCFGQWLNISRKIFIEAKLEIKQSKNCHLKGSYNFYFVKLFLICI